jgi:hypothetical protein
MLRHPFIMDGVGFNKYEGRVFLETRTSMLILKAYRVNMKEEMSSMAFLMSNSTRAPP